MPAGRSVRLVSLREVNALQASCPGCLGAQFGNHVARGFPLATRFQTPAALCAGWFGTDDEDPAPRLFPPPPSSLRGQEGVGSARLLPRLPVLPGAESPGPAVRVWTASSPHSGRARRSESARMRMQKTPLVAACLPERHAAGTDVHHARRSGLGSPFVASVGGLSAEVLDPVASGGGELPRPPDPWDGESGRVFKMLCPLRGRGDRVSCTSFRAPCSAGAGGRGCRPRVPGQAGLRVVKQVCPPGPSLLLLAPPQSLFTSAPIARPIVTSVSPGERPLAAPAASFPDRPVLRPLRPPPPAHGLARSPAPRHLCVCPSA